MGLLEEVGPPDMIGFKGLMSSDSEHHSPVFPSGCRVTVSLADLSLNVDAYLNLCSPQNKKGGCLWQMISI